MANMIVAKIQPLTPVWTGDAARQGDRVRETGILGSFRWWYEAIIRGLGLYACDPSSGSCIHEDKQGVSRICLACQLFGCTGYARKFRIVINGDSGAGQLKEVKLRNPTVGNHRGWRIPSRVPGALTVTFSPIRPGALGAFEKAALYHVLGLIEKWGALGAKTSHGQGVIKVADWGVLPGAMADDAWFRAVNERPSKTGTNPSPSPDLRDFSGVAISLDGGATTSTNWWSVIPLVGLNSFSLGPDSTWIPSAPAVRARLRSWLRSNGNIPNFQGSLRNERHRLMGTIQRPVGPKGSDIFVTHLYRAGEQWSMRIFAFVPHAGNAVDQAVRGLLQDQARLAREVKLGLGGLGVDILPYPDSVPALLGEAGRVSHE
jgi:CRISPR-associated protein Cmr1